MRLTIFLVVFLILANFQPLHSQAAQLGPGSSRQSVFGKINLEGPEAWPEEEGLSTASGPANSPGAEAPPERLPDLPNLASPIQPMDSAIPDPPQQIEPPAPTGFAETHVPESGRQTSGAATPTNLGLPMGAPLPAAPPVQEREVIYVDEAGNPVPKPPEPDKMLVDAHKLRDEGKYDDALTILDNIRQIPGLPSKLNEEALYAISDSIWAKYIDNPLAGYESIISSTNEALNANLRSPRVPDALLRLALANINVDNLGEAKGYAEALMRRFPDYPGVAQGFTALGQGQLKDEKFADAEYSFGVVLDRYPESSQLQDASVGLARALINQKKDDRAQVILDFISKRWPRYYINDPDFLLRQAANDERMNRLDDAMDLYWLYINLDPQKEGNDALLMKMGDAYMERGNPDAANFIYNEIIDNFPNSEAAVKSRLRLAEKGIYDENITYDQMKNVFVKANEKPLWQVYTELTESSRTNPDAVLARLKQAMWLFWDKQYPEAMGKAAEFIDDYPESPELPQARDVLWQSFQKELEQSLAERNYGRILLLWNGFPYIRERYGKMDAPLRYALSQGWLERGNEEKSFELLADFLKDPMDPVYGEAAFSQFFNHYLSKGEWNKILDLGNMVKNWKMSPELQNQLDYALALSAQNLNLGAAALNRWKNLAGRTDIPLYQQAYATYFLAKDAEQKRDIRNAYERNRKVVEMFTKLSEERSDKADPERIKESIASLMDICEVGNRVPEALEWVKRYNSFVGPDSPEYPGLRFREARLYRKLGDNARSRALLEDIAAKFPQSPFAQAASAELRTFDVSRDLQRYMSGAPQQAQSTPTGSTSGNWSSSGPTPGNQATN